MISSQFQELEEREVDANPLSQLTPNLLDEWEISFASFMMKEKGNLSTREQKVAVILEIQHITATILGAAGPSSEETIFDCFEKEFSRIIELAYLLTADGSKEQTSPIPTFDMFCHICIFLRQGVDIRSCDKKRLNYYARDLEMKEFGIETCWRVLESGLWVWRTYVGAWRAALI